MATHASTAAVSMRYTDTDPLATFKEVGRIVASVKQRGEKLFMVSQFVVLAPKMRTPDCMGAKKESKTKHRSGSSNGKRQLVAFRIILQETHGRACNIDVFNQGFTVMVLVPGSQQGLSRSA